MTCTCEIKWIDRGRNPTPDSNPAIGRCRTKPRVEQVAGSGVKFDASPWYNICAAHAARLKEPGMHIWEFEEFERA